MGAGRKQKSIEEDGLPAAIADYVLGRSAFGELAITTARWCLMDSLGCAMAALRHPACTRLLGPVVPGAAMECGVRVPGLDTALDPVTAAFNVGTMIRWLDYNDTWLASEWGHPSDNLGAILACADYVHGVLKRPTRMREVLDRMVQAYEIQGVLALNHAFNRVGLDHVLLARVASAAVAAAMLGGTREQVASAVSHAWADGGALRVYRHGSNTGSRKSWAAGDATSRGVRLALMTLQGEPGIGTVLSAPRWGFQDVLFGGKPIELDRPLGSYVMENILFKVSFPAEFHAQTAVEAAIRLHPEVRDRLDAIEGIDLWTQEPAMRIIDKSGPLRNPADRDHCLQYMVAVGLLFGELTAAHYEDEAAADPRIDRLRSLMTVREEPGYSRDYLDPDKRSIANAVQVRFRDGSSTERIAVEYPIGHRRRRAEAEPQLRVKFERNVSGVLPGREAEALRALMADPKRMDGMSVREFVRLWPGMAKADSGNTQPIV